MRTRRLSAVLAALSIPLLAAGAVALASSVNTQPGPQTIIPSRTSSESPIGDHTSNGGPGKGTGTTVTTSDDPAGHDANDDHGHDGATVTTTPGHDANDDHGHDGATVTTTPGHDGNDDHGHDGNGTTTTTDDHGHDGNGTTTTTTPDDHGGNRGPGGGGGSDDGPGHGGNDDHGGGDHSGPGK